MRPFPKNSSQQIVQTCRKFVTRNSLGQARFGRLETRFPGTNLLFIVTGLTLERRGSVASVLILALFPFTFSKALLQNRTICKYTRYRRIYTREVTK